MLFIRRGILVIQTELARLFDRKIKNGGRPGGQDFQRLLG
jgi:hypothetical protein